MASSTREKECFSQCTSCQAIFQKKEFELHLTNNCPLNYSKFHWLYSHIKDKQLYCFLKTYEHRDKVSYFNDKVLISLKAAQLCDIGICDPVILTTNERCIIRTMWPLEEDNISSIFLTNESLMELDKFDGNVCLRKMEYAAEMAHLITIRLSTPRLLTEMQYKQMAQRLKSYFDGRIIVVGQILVFNFLGNSEKAEVVDVAIRPGSSENDIMDLSRNLSVSCSFASAPKIFVITSSTIWNIEQNNNKENSDFDKYNLSNLGGLQKIKSYVDKILKWNCDRGFGIIIYGISGTGKSTIAKSILRERKLPVIKIELWENLSKYAGVSEANFQSLFDEAIEKSPSVIFIDKLELIGFNRIVSEQGKRILSILLSMTEVLYNNSVIILGVTNCIDELDPALRKQFNYDIRIPVPDAKDRIDILEKILSSYDHTVSEQVIYQVANDAHGFVGSDIELACTQAFRHTHNSFVEIQQSNTICDENLIWAFSQVKPCTTKEITIEIPQVRWEDIGGMEDLKEKLRQVVEWPLKYPERMSILGLKPPRGVLLYGPPGCSKTMMAKAIATESKLNFIPVKGAELFSKWVGDSEKAVKEIFAKARLASPSVIFFDEIDSIGGERSSDEMSGGGTNVQERVLSQLLIEMDGIVPSNDVIVIAATNRPDRIDKALMRSGRFDRKIYVPVPDSAARESIFKLKLTDNPTNSSDTNKTPIDNTVDISYLVERTEGYSGAEVVSVCQEAAMNACQDYINSAESSIARVSKNHFEQALNTVKPRTPMYLLEIYNNI